MYVLIGIAVVVVLILLWAMGVYNGLIKQLNLTKEGWSGIEVQLKRRSDLIPNLVETVKGYATHEKGTFEAITQARAAATAATTPEDRAKAEGAVSALVGRIVAISEAYPELKANQNFLELQKQLSEIEEQINLSRRYYNGAVRNYNTAIQTVPSNIVAGMTHFVAAEFFEIENPADRIAPKVAFG